MRAVLYFDGACWPNPGGQASYGWHLRELDNEANLIGAGTGAVNGPVRSNNVAEWTALLRGLEWVVSFVPDLQHLRIRGDSLLVILALTGRWNLHKPYLKSIRKSCRELLREIGCPWRAEWIPRHQNATADALACRAG
jgi:ribonuclease HI